MYSGVPLSHIVQLADLPENIDSVNSLAADGYILTVIIEDFADGILATEMEGEFLDEERGPVMLGFNVGCACNWMKQVVGIEFFERSNSLGLIGDVVNMIYVTIDDIRGFTDQQNEFSAKDLFKKAVYYPQTQSFSVISAQGEAKYPISKIEDSIVTYSDGKFNISVDGQTIEDIEALDCICDPDL